MFNILRLFRKSTIKRHSEVHRERMIALRAEGLRRHFREHGQSRKVQVNYFGQFSHYIYLPINRNI